MATKTAKKETFIWTGTDKKGAKVKGEIQSTSTALVKTELRRQGIAPKIVKKKPKSLFGRVSKGTIIPKDIALFSRQMSTMMSSGVPLVQSFDIIGKGHDNPAMQTLIMAIKADVEAGNTFADALAKHPLQFDSLYVNLVTAGEHAGILETLLEKIATYKEKTEAMKSKIKKAMFYPIAVVVVAFIITAILLIFVVPQFQDMFDQFGADLPALTLFVVNLSELFQEWWWAVIAAVGGVVFLLREAKRRSTKFNHLLDKVALKTPIVGPIVTKSSIARFARTLATMFAAGVPLVEAMNTVAGAAGNVVYTKGILQMRDEISTGNPLNTAMKQTGLFPNMVVQMVAIGEEAGSIDSMLSKVADYFEQEVDDAVDGLTSLLEPLIMAFLGVIVGGLVIAMYLPIFKMGSVV